MAQLSPDGPVYQAGTLSGNPLAMAAGIATLRGLQRSGRLPASRAARNAFCRGHVRGLHAARGAARRRQRRLDGRVLLHAGPVTDLSDAKRSDTALYGRFFHAMLDRGRLPRSLAVRGGLPLDGPPAARHRPHPRRRPTRPSRRCLPRRAEATDCADSSAWGFPTTPRRSTSANATHFRRTRWAKR